MPVSQDFRNDHSFSASSRCSDNSNTSCSRCPSSSISDFVMVLKPDASRPVLSRNSWRRSWRLLCAEVKITIGGLSARSLKTSFKPLMDRSLSPSACSDPRNRSTIIRSASFAAATKSLPTSLTFMPMPSSFAVAASMNFRTCC